MIFVVIVDFAISYLLMDLVTGKSRFSLDLDIYIYFLVSFTLDDVSNCLKYPLLIFFSYSMLQQRPIASNSLHVMYHTTPDLHALSFPPPFF